MKFFLKIGCWMWLILPMAGYAQSHPESQSFYDQAMVAYDSSKIALAIELFQQALDKEYSAPYPDTLFLAKVHEYHSLLAFFSNPSAENYDEYLKAHEFYRLKNPAYLGQMAADFNLFWSTMAENDVYPGFEPEGPVEDIFYSIMEVGERLGDTVAVKVKAGTVDGLFEGSIGGVLTRHNAEYPERGNQEIARAQIIEIGQYDATVELILLYPDDPQLMAWKGDYVQLQTHTFSNIYESIFQRLGKLSIYFQDLSSEALYSFRHLRHGDGPELENALLRQLVSDVHETAENLRSYSESEWDSVWLAPLEGGKYKGLNIVEAMEGTSVYDVYAFLDFVVAFPGKYMGHEWKINETYATWVLNSMPEGEGYGWVIDEIDRAMQDGTLEQNLDALGYYMGDSVLVRYNDRVNGYFAAEKADSAMHWARLQETIGQTVNKTDWIHEAWNNIGFAYNLQDNHLKAIEYYTKIIREDELNTNARYNRSNAYYEMEQYDLAIEDMQFIVDQYPEWADGYGNIGWYYMLDGNLEKSWEYTRKAYALDSLSRAWSVNLGHLYLFDNMPEKARPYYQQALELLESEDEYELGLKKDFEIFLEKGWHTSLVRQEKDWAAAQYGTIYQPYLKASDAYNQGKALEGEERYEEALTYFETAIREEQSSAKPRKDWLRIYATWTGFCHQKLGNWQGGIEQYQEAVRLDKELRNDADLANDLELLGWLFKDKGDKAKSDAYYEEAAAITRRLEDQKRSNSLYIISIGVDRYVDLQFDFASSDAKAVADLLEEKSRALFDYTYKTILTNRAASRAGIEEAIRKVITESKPGDTFILFFAGQSQKRNEEFYFIPSGVTEADSNRLETKAISANLLRTWVNSMQASRQYVLLDAAATSFINTYVRLISLDQGLLDLDKDIMLFSPFTPRIEKPELGHSVLVSSLLDGLNGSANLGNPSDSMITAREMDAFLFSALGGKRYYYKNQSYAHGMDFKLAFARKSSYTGIDTSAPEIVVIDPTATRGGMVETVESTVLMEGKIFDASPLESVQLNGKNIELTQNGKFSEQVSLSLGVNKLVISARDEKGNLGRDSLEVKRVVSQEASRKTTITFGAREGVDIALLFATNEYDEWSNLSNPIPDAEAIRKDLEELYNFKVELVKDASRKEILEYIRRYQARTYNDNDRLFIFFAGHGVYDEISKEGYIVAKDSKKDEEIKDFSYVPYSYLRDNVNNIPCKHILLVMDVCFGGTFDKRSLGTRGDFKMNQEEKTAFIQRTLRTRTRLFMTSGGKEYVPDGRPGSHSPFATRLLEALRVTGPGAGLLTFNDLITAVESLKTTPRYGDFGDNEPGSNFVFNFHAAAQQGSIVQKEANLK